MSKRAISTDQAPAAVGPYSQAIEANGFIFLSGQIPLDPATGTLIESDDVRDHVRRCMDNARAVLEAAGSDMDRVVKATVLLRDIMDFKAAGEAYAEYFGDVPPARAAFQTAQLPLDAWVEIEMIALSGS
jgi:2-iminobutanoate/2-iminopropanoate deaminase